MKQNCKYALISLAFLLAACQAKEKEANREQATLVNYLYHRSLISDTFSRMVYKLPIDCRGLDPENQLLYFIYKKDIGRSKGLCALAIDTNQVEFAPCDQGDCVFGGLKGNITGYYALRLPVSNLRVPPQINIPCKLANMKYNVSLNEMAACLDSLSFYITEKHFQLTSDFLPGTNLYATNIGAFISKKDKDPIMQQLSRKLTSGLKTKEEKIQALLHFVTNEIEYSYEDYWYNTEVTKRAHEVLISGLADCSGKSTLFASLLEAENIPYVLFYFNHHVNVGVAGSFPEENNLWLTMDNKKYFFAETTMPDFQIGRSRIESNDRLNKVYYYQKPQNRKYIYMVSNDQPLQMISDDQLEELQGN